MDPGLQLTDLLGPERVSTHPRDLERHSADWSSAAQLAERVGAGLPMPRCVVRPESTDEVASVLRWADGHGVPVVPFGAGSGVVRGIEPAGCVVIDMRSMARILDFDSTSRLVRVQAGIMGPDLARALEDRGFTLGHEPQSIAISTVGGWIATHACGQLSSRYGGIEDLVAGLEAVLPGGRVLRSKDRPRSSTGPDVASLMFGSEGTLGVVTEATLRVSPVPEDEVHRCLRFEHMSEGVAACRTIAQSRLHPTVVRLYDTEDSMIFLRHHPQEEPGPLLLLSFEGPDARSRAEAVADLGRPGDDALVGHWWQHRNDAVDEYRRLMAGEGILGPHAIVDTIEVSATWSRLRDLYHSMKDGLSPLADLVGCHLSHVYPDGACLYFTLAAAAGDDAAAASIHWRWWETAMPTCLCAGGSISHHHGIGRLRARWLPDEMGGWFEVLEAVKRAVDPHSIMNPGALGL